MANPTPIDLDAELGFDKDFTIPTKSVHFLGRDWTIVCDLNSFRMAQIAAGESSGIAQFLVDMFIEDERDDLAEALSKAKGLTGEKLGLLLQRVIEEAGERPTEPPSRSPRTAKKQMSSLKSVGS
jgi:hypothetical protein